MPIFKVQCPHCQRRLKVKSEAGGDVVGCPVCRKDFMVPAPPKKQSTLSIIIDPDDSAETTQRQREWTGCRCHDCGERIYEGQLVRRDIAVSSSSWFGFGSSAHGGWDQLGFSTRHGRVDLCRACNRERNEEEKRSCLYVAIAILATIFMVGFAGLVLLK